MALWHYERTKNLHQLPFPIVSQEMFMHMFFCPFIKSLEHQMFCFLLKTIFPYYSRSLSLSQPPDASVTGMPVSVCQTSKAVWCVCVNITLLGQIANTVPRSTGTDHGLAPLQTLLISVLVSNHQCLKISK